MKKAGLLLCLLVGLSAQAQVQTLDLKSMDLQSFVALVESGYKFTFSFAKPIGVAESQYEGRCSLNSHHTLSTEELSKLKFISGGSWYYGQHRVYGVYSIYFQAEGWEVTLSCGTRKIEGPYTYTDLGKFLADLQRLGITITSAVNPDFTSYRFEQ